MKNLAFLFLSFSLFSAEPSFMKLKTSAENGSQVAQYKLGVMCLEGKGVQKNPDLAVYWLSKAVAQGSVNQTVFSNSTVMLSRAKASNDVLTAKIKAETPPQPVQVIQARYF